MIIVDGVLTAHDGVELTVAHDKPELDLGKISTARSRKMKSCQKPRTLVSHNF